MKTRIKAIRTDAGLTQAEFAESLNMSVNAVSQMERDKIKPSIRTQELICDRFGINKEWLETGIGEMKKPPLDETAEILSDILEHGKKDVFYALLLTATKAYQTLGEKDRQVVRNFLRETIKAQHEIFPKGKAE